MAEITAKGVIVLVAPGAALIPGKENVKLSYIDGCVWQDKLLPVDAYVYEIPVRYALTHAGEGCSCCILILCCRKEPPTVVPVAEQDQMPQPPPVPAPAPARSHPYAGARSYTKDEDLAILNFLESTGRPSGKLQVFGEKVWKEAAKHSSVRATPDFGSFLLVLHLITVSVCSCRTEAGSH